MEWSSYGYKRPIFLSFHKCDKVHLNTGYRYLKVFSFHLDYKALVISKKVTGSQKAVSKISVPGVGPQ